MKELKILMTNMMQRLSEVESAMTTTSTSVALQPSPARIHKKNKSSTDQGGTSMNMDVSEVDHQNHDSS
jgi:hypothetical protein